MHADRHVDRATPGDLEDGRPHPESLLETESVLPQAPWEVHVARREAQRVRNPR